MLKRLARRILRRPLWAAADRARVTPSDGGSGPLMPPQVLQDYVGGDYAQVGAEFLRYFVELCQLKADEKVLDVGCGSGRMAVPLTGHLSAAGLYHGFDVSETAVAWCRANITARFPNFHFQAADLHNGPYNPKAKRRPSEFRFPYGDATFDLVFLASVFTHMLPRDVEHYLSEITRVLRPGGRCLVTYFLLNDESTALIDAGKGTYNFEHRGPGYRTINAGRPEDAIAYPEAFVRGLYEKAGLKIDEPLRYGSWCGRGDYLSFQDIVIATRGD